MCFFIEPVQDLDSRPPYSRIVRRNWAGVCVDVVQFYLFGHLQPDDATTADIPQIEIPFTEPTEAIPRLSIPAAGVPTADYTESFAQIQATVDKIQLKQMLLNQGRIFRNLIHDVQQEVQTKTAALSKDLNDFRQETQTGIAHLGAQLSEITAHINRGRDDKKGKIAAVEVRSLLKIEAGLEVMEEADLVVEAVVEVGVNHGGKEEVFHTKEELLVSVVGLDEQI
ncbi:mevalonate kinase-like [Dorcoceras hygrometricum]|uniref:Mevalonate kinase-like n=1 Tax=Dorcoceras hygrometricum TaxID=472368 RepID=A0A2Z7CX11_9LAMI|nr:mevalonate kinase-like [Dorcoceras hygrometricum]